MAAAPAGGINHGIGRLHARERRDRRQQNAGCLREDAPRVRECRYRVSASSGGGHGWSLGETKTSRYSSIHEPVMKYQ